MKHNTVIFDKTFSRKLTEARMASVSRFLWTMDLSITETGERQGFSSVEHFSSAFRQVMGCSLPPVSQSEKSLRCALKKNDLKHPVISLVVAGLLTTLLLSI